MVWISQVTFLLILLAAGYFIFVRVDRIRKNILLGKPQKLSGDRKQRFKTMLLVAFGQGKMFQKPIPALLHLMVYVGFLVINIEVLEFVIDGLAGTHRIFAPLLGPAYTVALNVFEFLAVAVMFSCIVFLIRRNIMKVKRFHKPEMKGWPKWDGNLILIIEIALMLAILAMNAADQELQNRQVEHYTLTGKFYFSGILTPLLASVDTPLLVFLERVFWWFHIVGILAFAVYVTHSKHLHIFMAFPNTYFTNLFAKGKIKNMEEVTQEVKTMLGIHVPEAVSGTPEIPRLGARDAIDLSWKSLMDAYACTECGRCTSECPANQTGKKLSPRKIMMDTRDRIEEIGKGNGEHKNLLGDYITTEEINACTSCNACTQACPINIDPLAIILEMRRYVVMEESGAPTAWNAMFSNIETSFAPWKFAPADRFNWKDELNIQKNETN